MQKLFFNKLLSGYHRYPDKSMIKVGVFSNIFNQIMLEKDRDLITSVDMKYKVREAFGKYVTRSFISVTD